MEEVNTNIKKSEYELLNVSNDFRQSEVEVKQQTNKIVNINGVFSNSAKTWFCFATNLGVAIYSNTGKQLSSLKESTFTQQTVS